MGFPARLVLLPLISSLKCFGSLPAPFSLLGSLGHLGPGMSVSRKVTSPVWESSFPTWIYFKFAWFLSSFPGFPWSSPFSPVLSLGRDVSGSAELALVFYALGTEHLCPRCSQADNTRIEETSRRLARPSTSTLHLLAGFLGCALDPQSPLCLAACLSPRPPRPKK
jgi:hypothetical protein